MIPILYGPTASGKSSLALEWAMANKGTIVNADALQVYNALPILTAQPSESEKAQAPHELYGFADPEIPMSAAGWAEEASAVLNRVTNPILVGGTGLYIKTLIEGIAPIPDSDPVVRAEVEERYNKIGAEAFHRELRRIDPDAANAIEPNNRQRLQRAMQVFLQTDKRFSDWHKEPKKRFVPEDTAFQLVVFLPDRDWVRARAKQRSEQMFERNVLTEIKTFGTVHGEHVPAAKALGFSPLWDYIQGRFYLDDAKEKMLNDTNAYIKRQLTWGRMQFSTREDALTCNDLETARLALSRKS